MTEDRLALFELIDQGANGDLVREMLANSRSGPSPITLCIAVMAQGAFFGLTPGPRGDHVHPLQKFVGARMRAAASLRDVLERGWRRGLTLNSLNNAAGTARSPGAAHPLSQPRDTQADPPA
jgi:hypothetical protein